MNRVPVESALIAELGYDADRCVLEIKFRDTDAVYDYLDVSVEEVTALLSSPSKGNYFNRHIKARHRYSIVEKNG